MLPSGAAHGADGEHRAVWVPKQTGDVALYEAL